MPLCLKYLLIFCIFLSSVRVFSQQARDVVITDPSITSRCKALLEKRTELQMIKQKLLSLRERNENLLKKVPEEKKTLRKKAERSQKMLLKERELNQLKIENAEEEIIKNGCPGLGL